MGALAMAGDSTTASVPSTSATSCLMSTGSVTSQSGTVLERVICPHQYPQVA